MKHTKIAIAAAVTLALAACGGGGDKSTATTSGGPADTTPISDSMPSVTTAAPEITTGGSTPATTTTIPADPVMPLTGLPIDDAAIAARPALVVKIDNHPEARPQSGLNQADIVYEENVEQLTRFAAVFQTNAPDPVGPIRSGRTQDVLLLGSLNQPIFAWSGGNALVTEAINGSDFVVANVQNQSGKAGKGFRSKDRAAPHNLYAYGSGLFTIAPAGAAPPPQQFAYRKSGETAAGVDSSGVEVAMDGVKVRWTYDTKSATYLRFQGGKAHNDAAYGQVDASNVIVLVVDYVPSPADAKSPEAQTLGKGEVYAFSAGKVLHGTWTRKDRLDTFQLVADDGSPIKLTPGRTWVELARSDSTTPATP